MKIGESVFLKDGRTMNKTYTTRQGQTWDEIAKEVYGKEKYAEYLMRNNPGMIEIFIFSAGMVLNTPELEDETPQIVMPDWRK